MEPYFPTPEAVKAGWTLTRKHLRFFFWLLLLITVVVYIPDIASWGTRKEAPLLSLIFKLVYLVMDFIVSIGTIRICLNILDDKPVQMGDLFPDSALLLDFLVGMILYILIVLAGLILLIIPGVIWAIKYEFFGYYIIDKKLRPLDALKASAKITTGIKWDLFIFEILLALINLVGLLCLGVGLFVTIPLSWIAMADMYRRLSFRLDESPDLAIPPVIA